MDITKYLFLASMSEDNFSIWKQGLIEGDLGLIRRIPKSDLHNHSALGSRFADLQSWVGRSLTPPPVRMNSIAEMDSYLSEVLRPLFLNKEGFEYSLKSALQHAKNDGVTMLEMSIDCWFIRQYKEREAELILFVKSAQQEVASDITFIPQLGINRNSPLNVVFDEAYACLDTGYFKSIDLYGEELIRPPEDYIELYRYARKKGLKLKAHTGEFGDAKSVQHTVETLELDEIQHGISIAQSPAMMKWISDRDIQLNICPTSNVVLGRATSLKTHPMRIIYDHGVRMTINSDDIMLFDQSVSQEFLNVFRAGLFSAEELNEIRKTGLSGSPDLMVS